MNFAILKKIALFSQQCAFLALLISLTPSCPYYLAIKTLEQIIEPNKILHRRV